MSLVDSCAGAAALVAEASDALSVSWGEWLDVSWGEWLGVSWGEWLGVSWGEWLGGAQPAGNNLGGVMRGTCDG